jgi:hypothetical protein
MSLLLHLSSGYVNYIYGFPKPSRYSLETIKTLTISPRFPRSYASARLRHILSGEAVLIHLGQPEITDDLFISSFDANDAC